MAAVHFIFTEEDVEKLYRLKTQHNEYLVDKHIDDDISGEIVDSSTRHGYFLLKANSASELELFMPK